MSDPTRKTAFAYGLVGNLSGFSARKTIYIGKDGNILYIDGKVKAGNHGADIAAKLAELKVEKK